MAIVRKRQNKQAAPAKTTIQKAAFDLNKEKEVGVLDLTLLLKITDEAINENLHKRFMNSTIYTYIGHVLISVNPFQDLGIYTMQTLQKYKGKNRLEMPPHVFAIAEAMYYNLKSYGDNQCVIISGESGAGKTEAAKQIMQYIANVSVEAGDDNISKIKDMVLATNPLLESFGCAKTLRNNNSSRHGKYLEIFFSEQHRPVLGHITNYLLEKQRVVSQITHERNFHIFYQFTKHCPPQYKDQYGIQGPETYIYTSAAQCVNVEGLDDGKDFQDTLNAMRVIGLSQTEQDSIFRILAAILWVGNISFVEDAEYNASIRDPLVTQFVAYLLDVDAGELEKAIIERIVQTSHGSRRGSIYHVPLNIVQATSVRDALAKGLYNNLFDWIVARVNISLKGTMSSSKSIGILDIYGFEIFETNSFEQVCINYVNEKLQQIFIQLTLKAEQDEYVQEQIKWTPIDYFNNKVVCDLIEATRPQPGLFAALNDSIKTAHADSDAADQVFAQRLSMVGANNKHFEDRRGKFIIKHYAGDVTYDVAGMTDKNKDAMLRDLLEVLSTLTNPFVSTDLFPQLLLALTTDSKKRPETASDKIKKSANLLVETLSKCQPSYIRTIKPNQTKKPKDYDNTQVLHQVKYLGLKENVRIRRAGFAYRTTFEKFVQRFYLLSPATGYAGDYIWRGDDITAVKEILRSCHIPPTEYQLGTTKAFIKTPETLFALEDMRDKYWHNMAARIQRAWRRYIKRKEDAAKVIQRAWRTRTHGNQFEQLRDQGTALLAGRKERRKFSLLGSRAYMGDYLGCNQTLGYGRFIASQTGVTEHVIFSCKGDLLLAKFGRSSKRLLRIFIITKLSFYVIGAFMIDNRLQPKIDFTYPLSSIKYVALSTLQDDWIAVALNAPTQQLPDILINTSFKNELVTQLKKTIPGVGVRVGATVEYQKKPGKVLAVKFVIGSGPDVPRYGDRYKSGVVTVEQGFPGNSRNPKRPRGRSGKVDYSKYYGGNPKSTQRFQAAVQQTHQPPQQSYQPAQQSYNQQSYEPAQQTYQPAQQTYQPAQQTYQAAPQTYQPAQQKYQPAQQTPYPVNPDIPLPERVKLAKASRKVPPPAPAAAAAQAAYQPQPTPQAPARQTKKAPAPPTKKTAPPPPPAALSAPKPKFPTYKAMYDYDGSVANSLPLTKDEIYYVSSVNGKWGLVKLLDELQEGWSPIDYLQECAAPTSLERSPAPAAVYASTPVASNGNGIGHGLADALKAKKTEETTLAGSLADALKKRQGVTRDHSDDEEDEDDW